MNLILCGWCWLMGWVGGVLGRPFQPPEQNNHCYQPVRDYYLFMCWTLEVEGAVVMTMKIH